MQFLLVATSAHIEICIIKYVLSHLQYDKSSCIISHAGDVIDFQKVDLSVHIMNMSSMVLVISCSEYATSLTKSWVIMFQVSTVLHHFHLKTLRDS